MPDPIDIISPEGIATVLGSRKFAPVNYANRHRALGDHLGLDVSEIIDAISHIPLCLHGEAHVATRKRIAKLIADSSDDALAFIARDVPEMLRHLLSVGSHDVMAEFVNPCVNQLISTNIGIPLDLSHDTLVSRLFSQATGVSKRRRMNAELADLRKLLSQELPSLTETEIGDRIALCILGTDALRGTLAGSLHAIFTGAEQSAEYPRTGVPYIDRQVLQSCPVDDVTYAPRSIVRARLDQLESSKNTKDRNRFFGYGAHVCLGRKLALRLWEQVQESINAQPIAVSITDYKMRRDDVFCIPETFEIEIRNG